MSLEDLMARKQKERLVPSPMWKDPPKFYSVGGKVVPADEIDVPKMGGKAKVETGGPIESMPPAPEGAKKMGIKDTIKDEFGSYEGFYKIPLAGGLLNIGDNVMAKNAAQRLVAFEKNPDLYKERVVDEKKGLLGRKWKAYGDRQMKGITPEDIAEQAEEMRTKDVQVLNDWYQREVENQGKEYTWFGKTTKHLSHLPTFLAEFGLTGGIAGGAKAGTKKLITKAVGHQVKTKAGKLALGSAGLLTSAATRTALRPAVAEKLTDLQTQEALGREVEWKKEIPRVIGDEYIENLSEELGEGLTHLGAKGVARLNRGQKLQKLVGKSRFGEKFFRGLEKLAKKEGIDSDTFWNRISTKAGYSNFLAEHGEERIGTILRGITDVDDFGAGEDAGPVARVMAGLKQDYEPSNLASESVVLGLMQATQAKSTFSNNRWLNHEAKRIMKPESYAKASQQEKFQAVKDYQEARLANDERPFSPEDIMAGHLTEAAAEQISPYTPPAKLTKRIKEAKTERKATEQDVHKGRQRQAAAAEKILQDENLSPDDKLRMAKSAMRGKLSERKISPIVDKMSPTEVRFLQNKILQSKNLKTFERMRALNAFQDLMNPDGAIVPTNSDIQLLGDTLGKDVAQALASQRSFGRKAKDVALDVAHLPRTFKASLDNSFALRQGIFLATSHPVQFSKWWVKSLGAMADKTYTVEQQEALRNHEFYSITKMVDLFEAPVGDEFTTHSERTEQFMSGLAENIPGIAASNRGFVTLGNQARFQLFYKFCYDMQQRGESYENNPTAYHQMAKLLNTSTGRGELKIGGKDFDQWGSALNLAFFAPRYSLSRFQFAGQGIKAMNPASNMESAVRKEAIRQWGSFLGIGFSVMGLLLAHGVDIEKDPRSSDFGKIKIGEDENIRLDIWGGYQQIARYFAQFLSGEGKSTGTESEYKKSRSETAAQFLRSKASPLAGLAADTLLTKRTMMGDPMTKEQFAKELGKQFIPITFEDMYDIAQVEGFNSSTIPLLPFIVHGIGVGAWEETPSARYINAKTDMSMERYGLPFEDLAPSQAKMLMKDNMYLSTLKLQSDFEKNSTPEVVKRVVEYNERNAKEVEDMLGLKAKKTMEQFQIKLPGITRRLGDWYINDERFEIYKEYMARTITHMLSGLDTSKLDPTNPEHSKAVKEVINDARKHAREYIKLYAEREVMQRDNARGGE